MEETRVMQERQKAVLQTMKQLIAISSTSESSRGILERLSHNLTKIRILTEKNGLEDKLRSKKNEYGLRTLPEDESLNVQWNVVIEALALLALLPSTEDTPPTGPSTAPPGLLSVGEEQAVGGVLQLVSLFGTYPYLSKGVGLSLKMRSKSEVEVAKAPYSLSKSNWFLYKCVRVLLHCTEHHTLAPLILSSVLRCDILTALIQLVYTPKDPLHNVAEDGQEPPDCFLKADDLDWCEQQLPLFKARLHPPMFVKDLLVLQGPLPSKGCMRGQTPTPKWFRNACGQLLSEKLMEQNGLEAVIRGVFDDSSVDKQERGKGEEWLKCVAVAKIVASRPSKLQSVSDYYRMISPQVLALFESGQSRMFLKVGSAILTAALSLHHKEGLEFLVSPLLQPLLISEESKTNLKFSAELFTCLKTLNEVISVTEPGSPLFVEMMNVCPILFKVWIIIKKDQKRLTDCILVKSLLITCLKAAPLTSQLSFILTLLTIPLEYLESSPVQCFRDVPKQLTLTVSNGEVAVEEAGENNCSECVEDIGVLVVELLLEPEIQKDKLIGTVFLTCLKYLVSQLLKETGFRSSDDEETVAEQKLEKSTKQSDTLLQWEAASDAQPHSFSVAVVLYVAAAICENVSENILSKVDEGKLVHYLATIIKCHADFLRKMKDQISILETRQEELPGGHVTLSIAFGLLSALMTAYKEIPKKLRPPLSSALPNLETIATVYGNTELAVLAEELRICIATSGAVWSRDIKNTEETSEQAVIGKGVVRNELGHVDKPLCVHDQRDLHTAGNEATGELIPKKMSNKLQKVFEELHDPLIPVQGHGLIELARLIEHKEQSVKEHFDFILQTLKVHLKHTDSYIYLAAIRGLVSASSIDAGKVVALLCEEHRDFATKKEDNIENERASHQKKHKSHGEGALDSRLEWIIKVGEALVKVTKNLDKLFPFYSNELLSAIMRNANHPDPLVRASSLSNLAEVCKMMRLTFTGVENEVSSTLSHVLYFDSSPQARQAAILVIRNIFKGYDDGECLKELQEHCLVLYHLLKHAESNDADCVTRSHAQAALCELDTKIKQFLFQASSLTKKISVLR